jgi:hypothetical protein
MLIYVKSINTIFKNNNNTFTSSICSPLTSCDNHADVCKDAFDNNITYNKNFEGYIGGQTISAGFLVNGYPCRIPNFNIFNFGSYSDGWDSYGISGTLLYTCDKYCGGYKCETEGLVDYSLLENLDCSTNETTKIPCAYGCDYATGLCLSSTGKPEGEEAGESFSSITTWTNYLFSPKTSIQKLVCSLIWSAILGIMGIFASVEFKIADKHGLSFFLIFFSLGIIFFTVKGFFPITLILLVIGALVLSFYLKHASG